VRTGDWATQLAGARPVEGHQGIAALSSKIDYSHAAAEAQPEDPTARIELAESFLSLGVDPETARAVGSDRRTGQQFSRFIFEDALRAGEEAEAMGATGWRVDAAIGLAHYYLGELAEADTRAERAAAAVPAGVSSWHAMAVLGLFAEARQRQIRALLR
jgi:hypothetical protein